MSTKYVPLVWAGIVRKPGRSMLIVFQIVIAFALFGVLQGIKTGVDLAIAAARADLLDVRPKVSGGSPLPLAYLDRIKALPGVKVVSLLNGFSATYQNPTQQLFALAIDPDDKAWLTEAPEIFKVSPAGLKALAKRRTGALVSAGLEKKYGWKLGDQIPLLSPTTPQIDGSDVWTFNIVGTYRLHELGGSGDGLIVINNNYLDEARSQDRETVQHFHVVTTDPRLANGVADAIDREFANSAEETRTESYREDAQREMKSIGDLNFAIRAIVSAVFVALLFSTATMMAQSIRERTGELAILKAVGFSDRAIFSLIAAESVVVWTLAAVLGLLVATIAFPYAARLVPGISMPWVVVEIGLLIAVLIALASALVPAFRAARLKVVTALAGQ
ncbi:MAG: FtsX-like permease family protein [Steroidobacteraceae bacterium]